jgi:hypothetical protein
MRDPLVILLALLLIAVCIAGSANSQEFGPEQLTIRDQFAIAAMQSLISSATTNTGPVAARIARQSYVVADKMLLQRDGTPP